MPARPTTRDAVPFLPLFGGLLLSIVRFRADDPIGGLAFGLGGVLAMLAVACWIFRAGE